MEQCLLQRRSPHLSGEEVDKRQTLKLVGTSMFVHCVQHCSSVKMNGLDRFHPNIFPPRLSLSPALLFTAHRCFPRVKSLVYLKKLITNKLKYLNCSTPMTSRIRSTSWAECVYSFLRNLWAGKIRQQFSPRHYCQKTLRRGSSW